MADATARFALPFLIPGQAQKELFHNEALAVLDSALQAAVEGPPQVSPPTSPVEGQCWIVAAAASGAWSGKDGCLAAWTSGGWRFVPPPPGMSVWNKADALTLRYDGTAWSAGEVVGSSLRVGGVQVVGERLPAIASPSGGTIIDEEARAAVSAVIASLMSHGLID
ncbi:MAG: hypothetical protein QOE79_1550 [Sphingomonadales bacterium]|jgi:hypothetical protein|nr:hypothetical protein [Sphingomonadales bacterium]MEA3050024.1 hypothetical protein [Sphingomonadales bacterium]